MAMGGGGGGGGGKYRQNFNISRTLVCNKFADHSDVVGASPVDLTPGFNGFGIDNYKTRWETFPFWDLVGPILDDLRFMASLSLPSFWGVLHNENKYE